ncbi:MAG: hypothetical protein ACXVJT_15930 [Thermoanaerobaculia bacterium]
MIRRVAAATLFAAIVVIGIEPTLLSLPFRDRRPMAAAFATRADLLPGYADFLADVRAHTRDGDSIAIIVPSRSWERGYSYAYYRASYLLAGRVVLPLVDRNDRVVTENMRAAHYVAAWGVTPPAGDVVVKRNRGVLVKRR